MKKIVLTALAVASLAGVANAQSTGDIQFRWRERAVGVLPVVGGVQQTVMPATAVNGVITTPGTATNATDSTFHLVLEAFVTPAASAQDIKGLGGLAFALNSNRTGMGFTSSAAFPQPGLDNPRTNTAANYTAAGSPAVPAGFPPAFSNWTAANNGLPGQASGQSGIFAPWRRVADIGGQNNPAIGVVNNAGNPAINQIVLGVDTAPLTAPTVTFNDGDDQPVESPNPFLNQWRYTALNSWASIFYATLVVTNVGGGTIDINGVISDLSLFRGVNNDAGVDSWPATITQNIPTFRIGAVPAPSAAALLGIGGLVATRRRRQA